MPSNRAKLAAQDIRKAAVACSDPLCKPCSDRQEYACAIIDAALQEEREEARKQTENSIKDWAEKFIAIFAKALEDIEELGDADFQPREDIS